MSRDDLHFSSALSVDPPPRQSGRAASPTRCLVVWVSLTVLLTAATALGVDAALDVFAAAPVAPSSFDHALIGLAGMTAAVVCPWLWILSSLTVADALRGRVRPGTGQVRRLVLLACGCALTLASVAPAHASDPESSAEVGQPATSVALLDGLPFPERPSSERADSERSSSTDRSSNSVPAPPGPDGALHVVERGDTLWAIAADSLHGDSPAVAPTSAETARAVNILHARNHDVLGDDADLIHPGQRLDTTLGGGQPR